MLAATYPTKAALRAAVGSPLRYTKTSLFGPEYRPDGTLYVVGPSPHNRKWYAAVSMKDGLITRVK